MLDKRMEQFEEEKKMWETQRQAAQAEGKTFDDAEPTMDEERERAWQVRNTLPVHQPSLKNDCSSHKGH